MSSELFLFLLSQLFSADSMKVMVTLLVVGVMDDARADILGNGNISLSFIERLSQVCSSEQGLAGTVCHQK